MRDQKIFARERLAGVTPWFIVAGVMVALAMVGTAFAASYTTAFSDQGSKRISNTPLASPPSTGRDSETVPTEEIHLSDTQRSAVDALNTIYQKKFAALIVDARNAGNHTSPNFPGTSTNALSSSASVATRMASADSILMAAANALQVEYNRKYREILTETQRGILDRAAAHAAMIVPRSSAKVNP